MTLADPGPPASIGASVSLERLRTRRSDGKTLRLALGLAVAVHVLAFLVPLPRATLTPSRKVVEPGPKITEAILEPPKLPPRPPRTVVTSERKRTLPVPDLPDEYVEPEPEPVDVDAIEADAISEAPVFLDVPASAAPAPPGPMNETAVGLVLPVRLPGAAKPEYPAMARSVRLEGTVVLEAVIDTAGRVTSIRVIREPGVDAGFAEAAIEAVSRWRYEPGQYGGQPVAVTMTVVVEFRIR